MFHTWKSKQQQINTTPAKDKIENSWSWYGKNKQVLIKKTHKLSHLERVLILSKITAIDIAIAKGVPMSKDVIQKSFCFAENKYLFHIKMMANLQKFFCFVCLLSQVITYSSVEHCHIICRTLCSKKIKNLNTEIILSCCPN